MRRGDVFWAVTTIDGAKLTERLGVLPGTALAAIEGGLRAALDLD